MENIRNLMSGIIFNMLTSCIMFLVPMLVSLTHSFVIDSNLVVILDCLLVYLVLCFIYCYFSENMTTTSFEIGDVVYNSLWYEMSMKQQKAMILMIARSQKEFRLTGLELVECSLPTFLLVRANLSIIL